VWIVGFMDDNIASITTALTKSVVWPRAAMEAVGMAPHALVFRVGKCRLWTFGVTEWAVLYVFTGITLITALQNTTHAH